MSAATEIVPAWQAAVVDASARFDYGDKITRSWLEHALGIQMPDVGTRKEIERANMRFFGTFELFRRELLTTHKKALRSLGRGEYEIVHPRHQGLHAIETLRDGVNREVRRSREIMENIRLDLLSLEEQRAHNEAVNKLAAFEGMTKRRLRGSVPTKSLPTPSKSEGDDGDDGDEN